MWDWKRGVRLHSIHTSIRVSLIFEMLTYHLHSFIVNVRDFSGKFQLCNWFKHPEFDKKNLLTTLISFKRCLFHICHILQGATNLSFCPSTNPKAPRLLLTETFNGPIVSDYLRYCLMFISGFISCSEKFSLSDHNIIENRTGSPSYYRLGFGSIDTGSNLVKHWHSYWKDEVLQA